MLLIGYDSLTANIRYYMGTQDHNLDGYRVTQGMQELSYQMQREIQNIFNKQGNGKKVSDVIKLNEPITTIHNCQNPVKVISKTGLTLKCHKALLCLPVVPMSNIKFDHLTEGKKITL